jgi:hypothetical protein
MCCDESAASSSTACVAAEPGFVATCRQMFDLSEGRDCNCGRETFDDFGVRKTLIKKPFPVRSPMQQAELRRVGRVYLGMSLGERTRTRRSAERMK